MEVKKNYKENMETIKRNKNILNVRKTKVVIDKTGRGKKDQNIWLCHN